MKKFEIRQNIVNFEVKENNGELTVSGYVNKTEQFSEMLGRENRFREKIVRGAFQRAIDKAKEVHFLAEHDNGKILSSTRNGSLQLTEDEQGLFMSATISPTSWGKDYYQLIKDGILQNMSFGFRAVKDAWKKVDGYFERTVNELELFEVSVVRDPAYSQSTISARGIDLVEDEVPQEELNLRTIEIRSDADIEAIAKKLFEMLSANVKIAEGHDTVVEDQPEEVVVEDNVVEEPVIKPEVVEEPAKEEPVVEEQPDEQPVDVVDEPVVEEPVQTEAEKLRDFIKKFQEE